MVAGGRMYALLSGGSYGSEGPIYTTEDSGRTWAKTNYPTATCDLTADGSSLFSLTSNGEIWTKPTGDDRWNVLKRRSAASLGQREYLYGILASTEGTLCVTAATELWLLDRNGNFLERLQSQKTSSTPLGRELFVRAWFASDDEKKIIVEANPYAVYVLDLPERTLTRWSEGVEIRHPDGMTGPARVIRHGDGFLMSTYDGVYEADGLQEPWHRVSKPMASNDGGAQMHCRAFCSFDPSSGQWLMADGVGIHVMQRGEKLRTVFTDGPDEHDLILDITPYDGRYFVSFARLKKDALGVVLAGDLSQWETLSLPETRK